jgi:hypothetical protein
MGALIRVRPAVESCEHDEHRVWPTKNDFVSSVGERADEHVSIASENVELRPSHYEHHPEAGTSSSEMSPLSTSRRLGIVSGMSS